jgi:vacuolar-type H+-ATPase subunit I/STV1
MLTRKDYFVPYLHSMLLASIAFGVIHGVYVFVVGIINAITIDNSIDFHLSWMITLIVVMIIQSSFFFIIGMLVAYFPSYFVAKYLLLPRSTRPLSCILSGMLLGILSLPLCAGVAFLIPYAPDLPGYLARCAEYALPMIVAGAVGGYFFWQSQSHARVLR